MAFFAHGASKYREDCSGAADGLRGGEAKWKQAETDISLTGSHPHKCRRLRNLRGEFHLLGFLEFRVVFQPGPVLDVGVGGKLGHAVRKSLKLRKKEGVIKGFIPGETFSIFQPQTLEALGQYPELSGDSDLERCNEGITMVLLG